MGDILLNVILPLYLLIGIGFFVGKLKPELKTDTISFIVLYLFAPALIFSSFRSVEISLHNLSCILLTALGVFIGVYLLSLLVERFLFGKKDEAFEISTTVMNAGYLGIPLIYLWFGEEGLPFAVTFMVIMAVYHFTLGIVILEGSLKSGLLSVLKIPLIYAVVFSFFLKGVPIPTGIEKIIKLAGDATLPLMLVSVGISLSRITPSSLLLSLVGTLLRFVGGSLFALLFSTLLACPPLLKKVLIVQSSLPSAILNFVLCERFNRSPEIAASIIFISTLLFPFYLFFLKIFL
jgi:predicted permease